MAKRHALGLLLLFVLTSVPHPAGAQPPTVTGNVTLTNKGISTIPSFTLGKPATTVDVFIRKGDVSVEPQFRVGLDGTPWAFLFWVRHRAVHGPKFQLGVGGHPAIAFRTTAVTVDSRERDVIIARRYLAGELAPTYLLAKHVSVGGYYLYAHGFENDVVKHTHFVAARTTFTNVPVSGRYSVQIAPQVYYLRTDHRDGIYVNAGVTLSRQNLPLSFSATVNKPIRTTVAGGQAFLWNVSVNYAIR